MPDSNYKKKIIPIKYTSREFATIKRDLLEHAQRYYSNSYKDFSENSFGSLMVDTVAYVGDILSYYLDYNVYFYIGIYSLLFIFYKIYK